MLLDKADDGLNITLVQRKENETVIQINLQHFKATLAALLLRLANRGEDITPIQEPWSIANKICGLGLKNYSLVQPNLLVGSDPVY